MGRNYEMAVNRVTQPEGSTGLTGKEELYPVFVGKLPMESPELAAPNPVHSVASRFAIQSPFVGLRNNLIFSVNVRVKQSEARRF